MSGKAQAGNDLISHDSETVRARLAIALRRRVPSCGLSCSSTQRHRHLLRGKWSSSVNQTQSRKKRKFVAEAVSYAKLNERPFERAAKLAETIGLKGVPASHEEFDCGRSRRD